MHLCLHLLGKRCLGFAFCLSFLSVCLSDCISVGICRLSLRLYVYVSLMSHSFPRRTSTQFCHCNP